MFNIAGNNPSGYNLTNSLRFRSSASAYLSRTPASAGDRQKWTWSGWVKRGTLSTFQAIIGHYTGNVNNQFSFGFSDTNSLTMVDYTGAYNINLATTQVFRDPSAWYHIVVNVDTTQATSSNRVKLYVNGIQVTAFSTATYPALNYSTVWNSAVLSNIGHKGSSLDFFDGYMSEVYFVGGTALTPSSFGETDAVTGSWIPKKYSGTYGTNGFYLPFTDNSALTTSSNVGLGKDFSGNTNYWVTNNISITAGTTYDSMKDVPTLTSATVANYAVMNPAGAVLAGGGTNMPNFAEANLRLNGGTSVWRDSGVSTINMKSGKWYIETTVNTLTGGVIIGLIDAFNAATVRSYRSNAIKYINATSSAYGSSYGAGNVVGLAIDCDGGTLTCYVDNVSQGALCTDLVSAMPTNGWFYNPQIYSSSSVSVNFGQRPFAYTPPTGFVALNTFNLPNSTIKKGNTVMDAQLWTGNGSSPRSFSLWNFSPDFIWVKVRNTTHEHALFDSVRGTGAKVLNSNSTAAQSSAGLSITSFDANGFTGSTGSVNFTWANNNGDTYVGWGWDAGSSTVTNTSGSISAQVRANTSAGFSVVTYTGTGANATVGHGLGVAPKMIIVKNSSTSTQWAVYHSNLTSASYFVLLNGTQAQSTNAAIWNNTAPTSSVFSIGNGADTNGNTNNLVAYCWAEIDGFSKFGSYTGNGSTDGTFVYTGFRPKFVMIKRRDAAGSWFTIDTSRATYNVVNPYLLANATNAQASDLSWDILSNGFKLRSSYADINASGGIYIYMAFAENPFKNSNAR